MATLDAFGLSSPITTAFGRLIRNPRIESVSVLSDSRIRIRFDEEMQNNAALVSPLNYVITNTNKGSVPIVVNSIEEESEVNPQFVDLFTSEHTNGKNYTVTVNNTVGVGPSDVSGAVLETGFNSSVYSALGTAPAIESVESKSLLRADVTFDEVMLDTPELRDPTKYVWDNGLVTTGVLGVKDGSIVQLATTEQTPGVLYTLAIDNPTAILLHTIDFTPSLGNDLDDPTNPATYLWALEGLSVGDYPETRVGGGTNDLVEQGGGGSIAGQIAPGIFDGSSLVGRKCLESTADSAASSRYQCKATVLNCASGSIAVRLRVRGSAPYAANCFLLGTRTGSGWSIFTDASGNLKFQVYDGTTTAFWNVGGLIDGAWHDLEMIVDWTADEMRVRHDGTAPSAISLSALVQANTTGGTFSVGGTGSFGFGAVKMQIERVLGWEAADGAESIDATAWTNVSKLGAKPASIAANDQYDTLLAYAGAVPVPCDAGNDQGLWYMASGDKATDDYPVGYSQALADYGLPNGFGKAFHEDKINSCTESERIETTWTTTNVTVSAVASDLIDNLLGFRMARKITATANNGYVAFPVAAVVSGDHSLYTYIAGNGGTVTGRLVLYDTTAAAEKRAVAFSAADGVYSKVFFYFGTATIGNNHELRIEIDTSGEAVNACHVGWVQALTTMAEGALPIPTFGATAAIADTIGTGAAGINWPYAKGSVETGVVHTSSATGSPNFAAFQIREAAGANRNRFEMRYSASEPSVIHYDDAAVNVTTTFSPTVDEYGGYRWYHEWDSEEEIAPGVYSQGTITDGVSGTNTSTGRTAAWTAANETFRLALGINAVGPQKPLGFHGYVRIWDRPGALD